MFKIPKPAIAHVVVKEVLHHFVVIYKTTDKYIEIMDPGDGQMHRKKYEDFKKEWTGVLVLLLPAEEFKPGNEKVSVNKRFLDLIKPHQSILLQVLFGAIIYTILGLSSSIFVGKILDFVLPDGNRGLLNMMGVGMIAILLIQIFIGTAKTIFTVKTGQMLDSQLILGYYKSLFKNEKGIIL